MKKTLKRLAWFAVILLLLWWWLAHPLKNTFDDGFAAGLLVAVALFVCWPIVSKAYDLEAREARKTPEQRRAEEAAAEVRVEAVRAKWKLETTPQGNRAKKCRSRSWRAA
jgi:hypothetical protein